MAKQKKAPPAPTAKIHGGKKLSFRKRFSNRMGAIFCKRSIIIISEHKTQHVPFSGITQFVAFVAMIGFVGWASFSSGSYMAAQTVLSEKDRTIATTTEQNEKVGAEFALLKRDLQKLAEGDKSNGELSNYAKMMTEQFASEGDKGVNKEFEAANQQAENNEKYNAVFKRIDYLENKVKDLQSSHDLMMADIRATTGGKIAELEKVIAATGIDKTPLEHQAQAKQQQADDRAEKYGRIENGQGGPFIPVKTSMLKDKEPELYFNMKRMMTLNDIVSTMPLNKPMSVGYRETSSFGTRVDPFRGALAYHSGVDLAGPIGTRIQATSDGQIKFAGWSNGYGNMVEVEHGYGFSTRYGHLSKILVKEGQTVKKGEIIAIQGSTGRSTGNHLHYEVRYNGNAIDPEKFLKAGQNVRS